jgi:hypothetical protein
MKTSDDSALRSARMVAVWANPERRARRIQSAKNAYTDPKKRAQIEIGLSKGRQSAFQDITGQKFGRLTVLRKLSRRTTGKTARTIWEVKCDCGKIFSVMGCNLHSGHTRSCGCTGKSVIDEGAIRFTQRCSVYRSGAKKRGLSWNLTNDQALQIMTLPCFFCGSSPSISTSLGPTKELVFTHGIDRLENNEGYELGNCVPCCFQCNRTKSDMSLTQFFQHIRKISDRWIRKKQGLQISLSWDGILSSETMSDTKQHGDK